MQVTIQLDTEEVREICSHLSTELKCTTPGPCSNDMEVTLKNWRMYAPNFIPSSVRFLAEANARREANGHSIDPTTREDIEATFAAHNRVADLLEKLLPYSPEEVPAAT